MIVAAMTIGCQTKHTKPQKQEGQASVEKTHFPNKLANKKYKISKIIGLTTEKQDYFLQPLEEVGIRSGNIVRFTDSLHFVSAYTSWCGNDCFTSVHGRYFFVDSLKVRFYTDSITKSGECKAPTVYTKSRPPMDLYIVKMSEGKLQLNHKAN